MTSTALVALTGRLAERFGVANDAALIDTLKQTCFKSKEPASDAQLSALMVVANEYGLNPFTKEIYAYPDQYKGIVPVVGVDGWIRIINEHPMLDGIEFDYDAEFVTCRIFRKDRTRPITITEYKAECFRNTDPWKNMPRRMLRHKALIQCARVAFGFAMYDDDEGAMAAGVTIDASTGEIMEPPKRGPQRASNAAPPPPQNAEDAKVKAAAPAPAGGSDGSSSPPPSAPTAPPPPQGAISAGQVAYLRKKLASLNIAEQGICDRFGVTGIELLTGDQFDSAKADLLAMEQ